MENKAKPVVFYTETNPIIVGQSAFIRVHNHYLKPLDDDAPARTSTVLAYDIITGEIETKNTIYQVRSQLKSINKSDHATVKDVISGDKWVRKVPLTDGQAEAFSDSIKHDLTGLGHTFEYITCDKCDIKKTCTLAFDLYNTDGDCLLK